MLAPVAALLLTGGASRRMGADKAALVVDGERLADRAARLLRAVADPVLEVGPGYTDLARVDEGAVRRGPLVAIAAGVPALPGEATALVLAVDMPGVTPALLAALAGHPEAGSVVPVDQDGRLQPLCARYAPGALGTAVALAGAGQRAMHALLDAIAFTTMGPDGWLPLAGAGAFSDLDTPADLARLRRVTTGVRP